MQKVPSPTSGFSTVEALLAASLLGLIAVTLIGAYLYGEEGNTLAGNRTRATLLAQEGIEAVQNIKEASFSNLTDGTWGLSTSSNQWNLTGVSDTTGIFTRTVSISTVDAYRKTVTATVSWQQNPQRTGSITFSTRMTDWRRAAGASWATVALESTLDLPGGANGIKVQVAGDYAYVIRSGNSANFDVVHVASTSAPVLVGTLSLPGTLTNIAVSGQYAYVTSGSDTSELVVVDISNPNAPVQVGTYNSAGSNNALGVAVSGNYAYLVLNGGNEFDVVNITNKTAPTNAATLNLAAASGGIYLAGSYAYPITSNNNQEMQVVNVSTPTSPTIAASLNLSGSDNPNTISGAGSTVYIGRAGGDIVVVNISTPTSPVVLGTLATGDTANDISSNNPSGYLLAAMTSTTGDFIVVSVLNPGSPTEVASYAYAGSLSGVAYSPTKDRAFAVGDVNTAELIILKPQ